MTRLLLFSAYHIFALPARYSAKLAGCYDTQNDPMWCAFNDAVFELSQVHLKEKETLRFVLRNPRRASFCVISPDKEDFFSNFGYFADDHKIDIPSRCRCCCRCLLLLLYWPLVPLCLIYFSISLSSRVSFRRRCAVSTL